MITLSFILAPWALFIVAAIQWRRACDRNLSLIDDYETQLTKANLFERISRQLREDNKAERDRNVKHTIARAGLLRDALLLAALNRKLTNALEFYADEKGPAGADKDPNVISMPEGSMILEECCERPDYYTSFGTMAKRIIKEVNGTYAAMRKQQGEEAANAK